MKIVKNSVVTARYKLTDAQDNLIEEGQEPMVYLHGGYDNIFPKIEEALEGKEVGFATMLQLNPEDAFGDYDAALVKVEPRSRFPSPLEVGMQFEGMPEDADESDESSEEEAHIFTVTDIADDKVVLDGNHPLAGIALRFSLTVDDVRAATDEEIAHGHVHGAHGHHHDDDEDDDAGNEYRSHPIH